MSFTFFTDRDLGKQFPNILAAAGLKVERHCDHFAHDASDSQWLASVSSRSWIAITHDQNIRYKPNELNAVIQHRASLLIVIGKARFEILARAFVATMPKVLAFLNTHTPPFIAKVYQPRPSEGTRGRKSGRVDLWYPPTP